VFLAKVDYQMSPRHRLTVRYNHQNFTGENFESAGTTVAEEHSGNSLVHTRTVNGSVSSVFSSTFFNELRAQYAQDQEPGTANTNDPEAVINQGAQRIIKRWQIADSATWIRGAHSFKVGADVNHDDIFNYFPGFFGGSYTFNSLASFNRGIPTGAGESFQQNFGGIGTTGPETHPNIFEFAAFVQDEWRVNRDLSLSLGVRYDIQSFAKPQVRNPDPQLAAAGIDTSLLNTDKNNFGPRVGLAWTPNSRTVFRAGYGLFYGRTPSIMVGTAHSNNGVNVISVRVSGAQAPTYPGVLSAPPAGVAGVKPSIFIFDPNYENPEVHQASAGVEYALGTDLSVGASYLFVAGRNLQRSRDFNVGTPVPTTYPIQGGGSLTVMRFPDVRPFSNFDRIIRFESTAESSYNGFTLELKKRFRNRLQASFAYTLGKVTDTKPDATAVVPGNAGDDAKYASNPVDFEADRAAGDNDVRHRVVFSGYWDMSYWNHSAGVTKALLDGWSMSWIASLQSGQPYSERVANDLNNDGNRSNDIVPGSRNTHTPPTSNNLDMRVSRRIPLGGKARLELIGEAYNLFNHTNVSFQNATLYNFAAGVLVPQLNLSNPRLNFGADSSTQVNFSDTQRIIQLAAKVTF
jgi:outer membrane receptor protein involved in Fe transport